MKIKSTVWIPCIVIPLALVLLLTRARMSQMAAAEEAAKRAAGVASVDHGTEESAAPKEGVTNVPKTDSDANREKTDEAAGKSMKPTPSPAIVTLQAKGTILFQDLADDPARVVTIPELVKLVPTHSRIVLKASKTVEYARVAEVLSMLRLNDQSDATIMLRELEEPMSVEAGTSNESSDGKSGTSNATYGKLTVYGDGTLAWEQKSASKSFATTPKERFTVEGIPDIVPLDSHVQLRVGRNVASSVVVKVLEALRQRKATVGVSNWPSPPEATDFGTVDVDALVNRSGPKKRAPPPGADEQRIPDITGNWTGEGWGRVELRKTSGGVFYGSYSDTFSQQRGTIDLEWSAADQRFHGKWGAGNDRFGELTVRMTEQGNVILGAFSADAKSKLNPGHPKLADLQWARVIPGVNDTPPKPYMLPNDVLLPKSQPPANAQPHLRNYPLVGIMPEVGPPPTDAQPRYQAAEEQIRIRAGKGLRLNVPPGSRTPVDSQSLKNTVTTAFDARQELLRQELADFRSRLDRLAKTLEARERDKAAIIQRRVDELLNPNLRWDATGSNIPNDSGTASGNRFHRNAGLQSSTSPTSEVDPAGSNQVSNSAATLQQFDPTEPLVREAVDVGIVSVLDPGHGQIGISLKDPGSAKVGDILELSRPNAFAPDSLTRFGRIHVIKVQSSNESVIAVLTHSTRHLVENRWDWMEPKIGDRVDRPIVAARKPKSSSAAPPKELEFLSQYPRFSSLSLDMTETQFRSFLEENKLVPQLSIPRDGQLNYSVPLGDGIRLTVMFGLDGKCRGIEPISGSAPSTILPHPASPAPVRAEKVVAKIFRLEQVDAASVAKVLQELTREESFSARISADITSNSVIVFGSPDDMAVIEVVIKRLDKAPESPSPKTELKPGSGSSPAAGKSNQPNDARLNGELKSWQGRWLLVSAEINGQEQKRDEVSTQSITVSGNALKIAVRNSETKGFLLVDGALRLGSLPGGTKAFTFQTPSGQITRQEVETVDGVTRAKDISYEVPTPLLGIYEFREGKLVLCFHDLGSKDTPKHPDKFKTTPDSDLHLYIFDKVAEPDAAAPTEAEAPPKQDVPAGADTTEPQVQAPGPRETPLSVLVVKGRARFNSLFGR